MGLLKLFVFATALLSFTNANPLLSSVAIVQDNYMIKHNHFFSPRKLLAVSVSSTHVLPKKLGKTFINTKVGKKKVNKKALRV